MSQATDTQRRALTYIRDVQDRTGSTPTLRELCEYMGYRAIGSAQDLVGALRKKGLISTPERQSARSLVLTDAAYQLLGAGQDGAHALGFDFGQMMENIFVVPCLGSVPAGDPLEAIEENSQSLTISRSLIGRRKVAPDKLFGLKAQGDSMIGAGILDGDWLVVESSKDAPQGTIVVARIHSGDATVKTLQRDRERGWYLQPQNARFKPLYGDVHPFSIVGRVIALQRRMDLM